MLNKKLVLFILTLTLIYGVVVVLLRSHPYELISYSKNIWEIIGVQDTENRMRQNTGYGVQSVSTLDDLPSIENNMGYSFYVAGHTYGMPGVGSDGLYAPFTKKFYIINQYKPMKFGFLLGDIVKEASNEAWRLVKKDLDSLDSRIKNFIIPGNHDVGFGERNAKRDIFLQQFGKTFSSFEHENDLFIMLDTNIDGWNFSGKQLLFLKTTLANKKDTTNNIFIFFHHVIWGGDDNKAEFAKIQPNSLEGRSNSLNFWDEVFPLFSELDNDVYIFSGDVGAFPNGSEFFYTKYSNVTFTATGMGGGAKDNFLIVLVTEGSVNFFYVPID